MAMDNKTVRDAIQVHGTNPQFLVEKILRTRIYESKYWKESCFGLTGMNKWKAAKYTHPVRHLVFDCTIGSFSSPLCSLE
jgi:hypothetical protein